MPSVSKIVNEIKEDGFTVYSSLFNSDEIQCIKKDFEFFNSNIKQNRVQYFSTLFRKSIYQSCTHFVSVVSPKAFISTLRSPLVDIAEAFFKEKPLIGEFDYRLTITEGNSNLMKTHIDDNVRHLYAFIMLTESNPRNGPTFLFKKSHKIGNKSQGRISLEEYSNVSEELELFVADNLSPGDALIFDLTTWHGRMPFSEPGREMLLIKFVPSSSPNFVDNMLLSTETLKELTSDELSYIVPLNESQQIRNNEKIIFETSGESSSSKVLDKIIDFIHFIAYKIKHLILKSRNRSRNLLKDKQYPELRDLFD